MKQRNLLLISARNQNNNEILARPHVFPKDQVKRETAIGELETGRQSGVENVRLMGF